MDTRGFLDRLLGEGKSLLGQTGLTNPEGKISDYGKGALSGGALGILLGSKGGRKLATYGGLAALGWLLGAPTTRGARDSKKGLRRLLSTTLGPPTGSCCGRC